MRMKILHYCLGFPPFRTGGMVKYCLDLIKEQLKLGNEVSLLWPGVIKNYSKSIKIKVQNKYKIEGDLYCNSFEIINPLPISLLDGIKEVEEFTRIKQEDAFLEFFRKQKFDVMHIHTLMGLPKECLSAAKKLNIKLIFTSHDYFGICPKCSLMKGSKICVNDHACNDCEMCNRTAINLNKIKILQSRIYRFLKDTDIVKKLRKKHINNLSKSYEDENYVDNSKSYARENSKYMNLRKYYIDMYKMMDYILFNSENTKAVYNKYFSIGEKEKVISISNSMISDQRKIKNNTGIVKLGYFGPISTRKGFYFLINVLDEIYNSGNDKFELHVHQNFLTDRKYIKTHPPYGKDEIKDAMDNIDILIIPSLWFETFGFTVLEALSFGVPVLVSENVGARDLVNSKNGLDFKIDKKDFKEKLEYCINNKEFLKELNRNINEKQEIKTMDVHCKEIQKVYESLK